MNPLMHISHTSDCVTTSLCHHEITEPERMGRSSEQVYNVMVTVSPKGPQLHPLLLEILWEDRLSSMNRRFLIYKVDF